LGKKRAGVPFFKKSFLPTYKIVFRELNIIGVSGTIK
jgi:hypothetical protein